MTADSLDLGAFFARIGYCGPAEPTLGTLQQIQRMHLLSVPFENLSIVPLSEPIDLTPTALYEKIVVRRRGGFCYELNGLLAVMLGQIGYGVDLGCGLWPSEEGGVGPLFDHLVLAVTVPGEVDRWLVDVGAGRQSQPRPLRLTPYQEQHHPETGLVFQLHPLDGSGLAWRVSSSEPRASWQHVYDLDLRPRAMTDFDERCHYHQTSPDSHFTQGTVCSRMLPDGRVTISKGRLILTRNGGREERDLGSPEAEWQAIHEWFGIDVIGQDGAASRPSVDGRW